ncbi:MAG TPA: prenyltransferase [Anaerolineales bacterium]|nr:prenyltransferase [Anaerolineales bacterium]
MDSQILLFIRMSRPLFLLGGLLLFALGAGIARYLGAEIDWGIYFLGQAVVTTLQLSAQYLNEYFDSPADQENRNRTIFSGGSGAVGPGKISRNTVLLAAATALTVFSALIVLLISREILSPTIALLLALSFLGAFFYSTPPISLARSGYGELTTSILVSILVPTFAFLLQFGELHRLVAMSTFPLMPLHLAMMLEFEFPDYSADVKFEKNTLLVRMGWERAMNLHNTLIISAYLLLALAAMFGLPLPIVLPALLTLPLGLLQIWQMRRIAAGARPNWRNLTLTGIVLFISEVYLLAFAFWTR